MAEIYDPDAVEGEEYVQEEQKQVGCAASSVCGQARYHLTPALRGIQYEIFKEQIVVLIDAGDNMLGTWAEGVSNVWLWSSRCGEGGLRSAQTQPRDDSMSQPP